MADISSITLPGGGTYDLKDKNAVPKYGMGKNLLDNSYFVGGGTGRGIFPVNQRGSTSYSGAVQDTIDRWKTSNANTTISLTSSGMVTSASGTSSAYLLQRLNHPNELLGKTVTLSFLTSTGLFTKTATIPASNPSATAIIANSANIGQILYLSSVWYVRLTSAEGSGNTYYAAKLELGTEQTLAHKEGSTWVLNEVPDYEYELYRCITFTADPSDTYANKSLATEQQLATVESGSTASRTYVVGEYFCWNGLLHRVISPISSGGTFTSGTNCEPEPKGGFNSQYLAKLLKTNIPANSYVDLNVGISYYSVLISAVGGNSYLPNLFHSTGLSGRADRQYNTRLAGTTDNPGITLTAQAGAVRINNNTGSNCSITVMVLQDTANSVHL